MTPIPRINNDEFIRMRYTLDQMEPTIEHRTIEREQVGTWLFGLLPVYRYYYSEWTKSV
jgi:hypothetical protein